MSKTVEPHKHDSHACLSDSSKKVVRWVEGYAYILVGIKLGAFLGYQFCPFRVISGCNFMLLPF